MHAIATLLRPAALRFSFTTIGLIVVLASPALAASFRLALDTERLALMQGGGDSVAVRAERASVAVRADRSSGFEGEVTLQLAGLPTGVSASRGGAASRRARAHTVRALLLGEAQDIDRDFALLRPWL
jgi:hypothetical protein